MRAALTEILYRSDRLEVRRLAAGDGRRLVVTFESYHDDEGFDRPGFGQEFFAAEGVSAIHLLCRTNDWFQYAETANVLARVRDAAAAAERCIAYGSSMGGYAAVRFAAAVGAEAALALSPQYSVDLRRARFDRRWLQDRRRIRCRPELDGPIRPCPRTLCAYDPEVATDRRHVDLIAAEVPVERIALPFAGHVVGAFLSETELLRPLVLDLLAGTLDAAALLRQAADRAERSPTWLAERAGRLPPARRAEAVALSERAAGLAPDNPAIQHRLAIRYREAGRFEDAVASHERALAIHASPIYLWGYSKTLAAAGRPADALAAAHRLRTAAPQVAGNHRWAAELALASGDRVGALAFLRAAALRSPEHRGYRIAAARLAWNLRLGRLGWLLGTPRPPRAEPAGDGE